jgi:predicted nucleotidyltransferase
MTLPAGASLVAAVARVLRERGTPFAAIGASAMAAHGVVRATTDIDFLVVEPRCLEASYWESPATRGLAVDARRGDAADPLAGVVRLRAQDGATVDVVVGKAGWQAAVLARAREAEIEGVAVPVADRADLILLKLYAGGHQDAWDVVALLEGPERVATEATVERHLGALPEECRALWHRLAGERERHRSGWPHPTARGGATT